MASVLASSKSNSRRSLLSKVPFNVAYLYLSPWIAGFLIFQCYPLASSFIYSLTDYSILSKMRFVGLDNYIKLLTSDAIFRKSLAVTLKYVLIAVPFKIAFALIIAMIVNMKVKFVGLFRTMYYLPSLLGGSVAIAILWRALFSRDGMVNTLLPIPPVDWLGSPKVAMYTLGTLVVWQFGSSMLLFLAALKNIPAELYEAARMDGAGKLLIFRHITFPMISSIVFFNLLMQMLVAFQEFTSPMLITGGGPLKETYLYTLMLYETGFKYLKMGYASAMSCVMFVLLLLITLAMFKSSQYWVHYEDGGDFSGGKKK